MTEKELTVQPKMGGSSSILIYGIGTWYKIGNLLANFGELTIEEKTIGEKDVVPSSSPELSQTRMVQCTKQGSLEFTILHIKKMIGILWMHLAA